MNADQAVLFTYHNEQPPTTDDQTPAPTCPSCRLRPVRWNRIRQEHSRYCGGGHCSNHVKLCHWCNQEYPRLSPGSGTKYCSDNCKAQGYQAGQRTKGATRASVRCERCGHGLRMITATVQVCSPCARAYASQIKMHHLDTGWAIRLIDAKTCDSCGEQFRTTERRHSGVVDHDHDCCPAAASCGQCVRGIICNRCNTIAGSVEADPDRYLAVRAYLAASMRI